MADYHIYLHSEKGTGSKTTPFSKREENGQEETSNTKPFGSKYNQVVGTIQNPDSLVSKGIGALTKAIPIVACAYATFSLVDKIASTVIAFQTINTGNFATQINYQNFKNAIGGILRPFGTAINYAKSVNEANVNQRKVNEEMRLLGDSIINNGNNNNYGV